MKIKLESEEGEFICDLDLAEQDVMRMINSALLRLQKDPNGKKFEIPLKETDIIQLLQYEITSTLQDEINNTEKK